jgi:hypothetical protein
MQLILYYKKMKNDNKQLSFIVVVLKQFVKKNPILVLNFFDDRLISTPKLMKQCPKSHD